MKLINKSTLTVLTLLSIYTLFGYFYIYQNTQTLIHQKYKKTSLEMKATLETLIQEKKEAILLISLTLSNDTSIKKSLEKGDFTYLNLDTVAKNLKRNSPLKNVWFQILTNDGTSFYRSWTDKRDDSLIKKRLDIAQIIQKPRVISSISTGKFDMTFKAMVPIYNDGKFIGAVETIARFNSIAIKMQAEKNQTLILVDKAYKQQLTKAITQTFIHDYYVANFNPNQQLIEIFKKGDRQKILNLHDFILDYNNSLLLTTYQLLDSHDKPMGYFIISKNFSDIDMQEIWHSNKKIIFTLMTIAFILAVFSYYIYITKYQNHIKEQNKKLEKDVKERTKELNKSLEVFGNHVIASESDINGKIIYASVALCEISGYSNDELIGKPHSILRHPDTNKKVFEEMWHDLKQEQVWNGDIKNSNKDGSFYWVRNTISPKYNEDFKLIGYSSVRHDITKSKTLQKEVKEKDAQLLTKSRLAQMGEMISMIAHQWRQPLSAISSTSLNIKIKSELETFDFSKEEEAKEYEVLVNSSLDKINSYVQNLSSTIDDFRNFFKPDKKKVKVKLQAVVSKALAVMETSLINENIELIEEYHDKEELELHDSEMMQVILNILKNSQDNLIEKQIKKAYIKITIQERTISICDNGGGIPEDILPKIFDPYFSTKDEKNGTGLGLYMSKTIVEEHHNGKLTVVNTDYGVCFKIELGTKI